MAIAKVVYKESSAATPSTWMDVTQKTVTSATMLSDVTALKNDGTNITGTIAFKNATNLTASASTVTVASGYYSSAVTKNVDSGSILIPSISITTTPYISLNASTGVITAEANGDLTGLIPFTSGYISSVSNIEATAYGYSTYSLNTVAAHSYTPTETAQTISSGQFLTGVQTIKAISSTYVGTGVPTLAATTYTPSETAQWITSGQYLTGTQTIKAISSTYVGTGVPTLSAAIIFPSTAMINIESGQYITGIQTFASVKTVNLEASYIVSGITVKVGDDYNASRIAQVTGTYEGGGGESFAAIYKSLAFRSRINSNASLVSEWADSFINIASTQNYIFAAQPFSGSFVFNNLETIDAYYAFAYPVGNFSPTIPTFNISFPKLSTISYGAFYNNKGIRRISAPKLISIATHAFANTSITAINTSDFEECTTIESSAFYNCFQLGYAKFPKCTYISMNGFYSCISMSIAEFPKCVSIGYACFDYCRWLASVSFPLCETIDGYAFASCSSLASVNFPECTLISAYAFYYCSRLESAYFPKCTMISNSAFVGCTKLSDISFPLCETIGISAFSGNQKLTTVYFPECTSIGTAAFYNCIEILEANFPECTTIGNLAFGVCKSLSSLSFPKCTTISSSAFWSCSTLTSVSFSLCETIGSGAFGFCSTLAYANFSACLSIGNSAFYNCKSLSEAYFMNSVVTTAGTYMFNNTPIANSAYLGYWGSIYVPSSLLATYQTATNWVTYSARMVGI